MFLRSRVVLKEKIFDHFNCFEEDEHRKLLSPNDFELKYYKTYPKERNADKMMMGNNRTENVDQLLRLQSAKNSRKLKETAELREGGAIAILIRYRKQLQKGFKLVANDIRKQRNGSKKQLKGTAQMENCVKLLMKNEIDREAIGAVLHFAYECRLFGDTTSPKEEGQSAGESATKNPVTMMPDLVSLPEWFRAYRPSVTDHSASGTRKQRIFGRKKKGKGKKRRGQESNFDSPSDKLHEGSEYLMEDEHVPMGFWMDPNTGRQITFGGYHPEKMRSRGGSDNISEDVPIGFWIDPATNRQITFGGQHVQRVSDSEEDKVNLPQTYTNKSDRMDTDLITESTRMRPRIDSNIDSDSDSAFDPIAMQLDQWAAEQ